MHPNLDFVEQLVHVFGYPVLIGVLVWAVRVWDGGRRQFKDIESNTKTTLTEIAMVKSAVGIIESNHLTHLQDGIEKLTVSNDKAVDVLHEINKGIGILVDRTQRNN